MSVSDFRQLIDLHGGAYIGVECTDGVMVELGYNGGTPLRIDMINVQRILIPAIRSDLDRMIDDGMKKHTITYGPVTFDLTYFDLGTLYDVLNDCVRKLA